MLLPKMSQPDSVWLEWVNTEYPYAPGMERWLRTRQPHQRAPVGSRKELDDLRGIRDRSTAVMLARLWVNANRHEASAMREEAPRDPVAQIPPPIDFGYGNLPPPRREPEQQTIGDWASDAYP